MERFDFDNNFRITLNLTLKFTGKISHFHEKNILNHESNLLLYFLQDP